jgi:hypothetical protein
MASLLQRRQSGDGLCDGDGDIGSGLNVEIGQRGLREFVTVVIEDEVAGDGKEIGFEGAPGGVETGGLAEQSEEAFLGDVFGEVGPVGEAPGEAEDGIGICVEGLLRVQGTLIRTINRKGWKRYGLLQNFGSFGQSHGRIN